MKKKITAVLMLLALCASMTACGGEKDKKTDSSKKITVVLDWTPNTNHTGIYVAQKLGYFKDAGLEVKIQEPPEDGATVQVASGKAQFGFDFQEYLAPAFKKGEEMGVTVVASVIQHNTSGLVSLKEKGIESPADLEGHTYATWDLDIEKAILHHLIEKDGGNYDKLTMIPNTISDAKTALLSNQVDAIWIYKGWDGMALEEADIKTNFIDFGTLDSDLDFYSPVLIGNDKYLKEHKEDAKKFVSAVKKGYEYAIERPQEAAEILCEEVPELDKNIVLRSQKWLADKYQADAKTWGMIDADRWNRFFAWLKEKNVIDFEIEKNVGFTNDFLE